MSFPKKTIYVWKKYKNNAKSDTKTIKIYDALFIWFMQLRRKKIPISGFMLQTKALQYQKTFKDRPDLFTASNGHYWFNGQSLTFNGIIAGKLL